MCVEDFSREFQVSVEKDHTALKFRVNSYYPFELHDGVRLQNERVLVSKGSFHLSNGLWMHRAILIVEEGDLRTWLQMLFLKVELILVLDILYVSHSPLNMISVLLSQIHLSFRQSYFFFLAFLRWCLLRLFF